MTMSDQPEMPTPDTPQVLLEHHLKTLRLPTILNEYDKVARQCAAEQVDYPCCAIWDLQCESDRLESVQCVVPSCCTFHAGTLRHLHEKIQIAEAINIENQAVLWPEGQSLCQNIKSRQ